MDILKEMTANKGAVVITSFYDNSCISLGGSVDLKRGSLSVVVNFWGNVSMSNFKGYFTVNDMDWETHEEKATIGGAPIDNLHQFRDGLRQHGMSTIAESYELSSDEIKQAIYESLEKMPRIGNFFGKKLKCYDALSEDAKRIVKLDRVIECYQNVSDWEKNQFGLPYDAENLTAPTLEELKEYRNTL